ITIAPVDGKPKLAIGNAAMVNQQGKALKFQDGDILVKINGEEIPDFGPDYRPFIERQNQSLKEGGILSYTVLRKNEADELKSVELSAPIRMIEQKMEFITAVDENATAEQLATRKAWLSK